MKKITGQSNQKKYFCLHCFELYNCSGKCCGWETFGIPYKARPLNNCDNYDDLKRFFQLFLSGHDANEEQLKNIIKIRKSYGLSTKDQERQYARLKDNIEPVDGFLDIKRSHLIQVKKYQTDKTFFFVRDISNYIISVSEKNNDDNYIVNNKYYMVPIYGYDGLSIFFPHNPKNYRILKVNTSFNRNLECHAFKILTNNINEYYNNTQNHSFTHSEKYIRQSFLIFETKDEARIFRYKYLRLVLDHLKNEFTPTVYDLLIKEVNYDYDVVSSKYPECLI